MLELVRPFFAPLLSLVLLIMASGLFNTFISLRLEIEGYSTEIIGFVASSLYGGMLVGSLKADQWIAKLGHIRAYIIFAIGSCILVLAQGFWIDPWYWSFLRFLGGICMAGIFIAIESWLLMLSTASTRGVVLSIYLGVFYGALSLGQFLINVSDPAGAIPFSITAFLCALSILPLIVRKTVEPKIEQCSPLNLLQLFRISPLGFIGGIISGMILAAIYGMIPVYGTQIGLSVAQIGNLMAVIIFGGLSLQWPLGRWADQGKRRKVLCLASFLSAIFSLLITFIQPDSFLSLLILAWCFGGFSFTLYPLSMAYTCERVNEGQIIAATGGFVLSYGMGAIAGPLLAPLAMGFFNSKGLFYFLTSISLLLGIIGLIRPKMSVFPSKE